MDQVKQLLAGMSVKQRITILLAAALTIGGLVGFIRWKRESDFRPLYSAMQPEDAAAVVQKLRETGVEYRLGENGASVLVPSAKLAESRLALAAAGLPKTGRIGFELFDRNSFGATEFVEHVNYKRALEGELERSVMSLAEVEEARVHLTLAKESIFVEKQQPAKASVMLKLRPGGRLSPQNVAAVANLVASSVEGLAPEGVSIVDMSGNLLNRPRRGADPENMQITSEAIETRQQLERDLISKINSTLEPLLGAGRFRAGASLDYDLTSGEQQDETVDPTHSVMVSSQKTEDLTERSPASGGIPGTNSNLPGGASSKPAGAAGGNSRRTENIVFQSNRTIRHMRIPQGIVRRMSLAVLVDHSVRWEGDGVNRRRVLEPPSPEILKTIRDVVAAATGVNAERGDQLIVESLPFEASRNAEPPQMPPREKPQMAPRQPGWAELLRNVRERIGLAVAGGLLLLLLLGALARTLFRKPAPRVVVAKELPEALDTGNITAAQPALLPAGSGARDTNESDSLQLASRVRNFAESETAVTANLVRLWLQESEVRS